MTQRQASITRRPSNLDQIANFERGVSGTFERGVSAGFNRAHSDEAEEDNVGEAYALVGHDDGRIQLIDLATGNEMKLFDGHKDYITCLDSHWPKEAVSAAADGTIFHWNLEDGSGVELTPPEELLITCVRSLTADWNEKRLAVSGNDDGYFVIWDLATHQSQKVLSCKVGMIFSICADWTKMRMLVGHGDNDLDLLSLKDGSRLKAYPVKHYLVTVIDVCWPKARALIGFDNGVLQIWGLPMAASQSSLKGHKGTITALSVQWKLKRAISGSQDKSVRLWNIQRSECIRIVSGHLTGLRSLCVDWDLGVALSSAWDGEMQLWEIADEVDVDSTMQPVGGEVRAGAIALLTVKEAKDENSEEEAEEIVADTRDAFKLN
ncbi:unnamed protein product [Durusdinium trenchii]|uniref:Guanine nucleotide-binding protein subunit beta-like protein n=1 Tax=Durusdinium trenchii TaxID=1381693 RepID=A0ABP0HYS9_9DINO